MAETPKPTSSKGVGSATGSSLNRLPDHGVSDAQDASPKIKRDDFFADLDSLIGQSRVQRGCTIGQLIETLDDATQKKLNEIMRNDLVQSSRLAHLLKSYGFEIPSTDVLRRHRRRLQGKDGCMCNRES